jgi:hypothetical protein
VNREAIIERIRAEYNSMKHGPGVYGVLAAAGFFDLLEAAVKTREHLKEECKIFGHDCDNCMNETCLGLRAAIAKITGDTP